MNKFLLFLFSLLVFLIFTNPAFASDKISSFTYEEIVKDYTLPYPGLLPDNRFYFLKMTRDKIMGMLISDPLKKADFDTLAADKRLNAGIFLLLSDEKKYSLATSTISKGENYLVDAVMKIQEAKRQGIGVLDTKARLSQVLKKHAEILKRLGTKFKGDIKGQIQLEEKKVLQLQKTVSGKDLL